MANNIKALKLKRVIRPIAPKTLEQLKKNSRYYGSYVDLPKPFSIKVEEIKLHLLEGSTRAEMAKAFNCTIISLELSIRRAKELIYQELDDKKDFYYAKALKKRDKIYHEAMADKKYTVALAAEIDKAKLLGLYPTVIDQVGNVEAVSLVFQLKGTRASDDIKVVEGEVIE